MIESFGIVKNLWPVKQTEEHIALSDNMTLYKNEVYIILTIGECLEDIKELHPDLEKNNWEIARLIKDMQNRKIQILELIKTLP